MVPGFDFAEAKTLLCIEQQTYEGTPNNPASTTAGVPPVPAPPGNWQRKADLTPTRATLLDNYWEVWQNQDRPNRYAIAVRGTVKTPASILADLLLPVVKARYEFSIAGTTVAFNLAREEPGSDIVAGVHAGFTLSLLLMLLTTDVPLLPTLAQLSLDPANEIYVTGHSQGASIAQLLTSFVRHSDDFSKASYKTYVFAPAKPGNDHYVYDLDRIAAVEGLSFAVVNSQDWVPQVPLTLEGPLSVNTPNPLRPYSNPRLQSAGTDVQSTLQAASGAEDAALPAWRDRLDTMIASLKDEVGKLDIKLPMTGLSTPITGVDLESGGLLRILDMIKDAVLPTLNYAKGGAVTPVFGVAGANPKDPKDYFWQHHLGNYLKYLEAGYGI